MRTGTTAIAPGGAPAVTDLAEVLALGLVTSVFQPIVDLSTGGIVAHEALARGPRGPLSTPDRLFAAARGRGLVPELDGACLDSALRGAVARGLTRPHTVFVNIEPAALETGCTDRLERAAASLPPGVQVVVEFTERALASRPAELVRTAEIVRGLGWGVALDDVGADPVSLVFLSLLRPDVVKLDLSLVQERPGAGVARTMTAVTAFAERTGALVLAEGVETPRHRDLALSLGASLGQGWLFGHPVSDPVPVVDGPGLCLPVRPEPAGPRTDPAVTSPYSYLPARRALRQAPKSLLIEVSKHLEREALRLGDTCLLAATFQRAENFTPDTAVRYGRLAGRLGFTCVLGEGLAAEPLPGLRGADLRAADPVRGEWDVAVLDPHFAAALVARDLGDGGPDADRRFEFALTYDRSSVELIALALVARVAARTPGRHPEQCSPG